jgi:hypothetical protein
LKTFWLLFGDKSQAGIKKKTKAEGEKWLSSPKMIALQVGSVKGPHNVGMTPNSIWEG